MGYKPSSIPPFKKIMGAAHLAAITLIDNEVKAFAEKETHGFKEAIKGQKFVAFHKFPLSPRRLAQKAAAKADLRVMIATGHYLESIKVFRKKGNHPGDTRYRIGFHPLAKARDLDGKVTDILLSNVAKIQEYGSKKAHIPARPHWGPYLREMEKRATVFRAALTAKVRKALKDALKKKVE